MKLDALLLFGLAAELRQVLAGAVVRKISQLHEADFLWTFYHRGDTLRLLVSLEPDSARVHLVGEDAPPRPAAQTPGAFCMLLRKHVEGLRVDTVDTWGLERVVRLHFAGAGERPAATLAVEMTVLERNMLLRAGPVSRTWHRPGESSVLSRALSEPPPQACQVAGADLALRLDASQPLWRALIQAAFGINRLAAEEVCRLAGQPADAPLAPTARDALAGAWDAFRQRVLDGEFAPVWDARRRVAAPWAYGVLPAPQREASFSSLLSTHMGPAWATRALEDRRRQVEARLLRLAEKLERRVAAQSENLAGLQDVEQWRRYGELLLSAPPETRPGGGVVRVPDYYADGAAPLSIAVDERRSLVDNAQTYFTRYKKGLRGREAIQRQLSRARTERAFIDDLLHACREAATPADLEETETLLRGEGLSPVEKRGRRASPRTARRSPIRRYRIEGYDVLLGRNPRQNEELSLHLANPDDVWLHARQVPGAHVLIRSAGHADVPQSVLLQAAALAALHSQAAASGKVSVDYTQARYLRKPPESPPGIVTYRQERTVVVRTDPETARQLEEMVQFQDH